MEDQLVKALIQFAEKLAEHQVSMPPEIVAEIGEHPWDYI